MTPAIIKRSFLHSVGVLAYISLVASVMQSANTWFGTVDTVLTVVAFLLMFTLSAAVVGSLVFGYPVMLFLGGQKKEGAMMAAATIGWLFAELVIVFILLAITR